MSTELELLQQTRKNLISVREKVTRSPKPTYTVDGTTYKWEEYLTALTNQIDAVQKQIDDESDDSIVEEHTTPWLGP
jgi:hypothetical protein